MKRSKLRTDGAVTTHRRIRKVGLISPTSGNLGNAAMQSAMIENLRKRIAGVEILGITLNPADTRRRHGIEAFPLAGVSRPYYAVYSSDSCKIGQRQTTKVGRAKEWLKKIPGLRAFVKATRVGAMELTHLGVAVRVIRKLDCVIIPGGGTLDDFWGGPWGQPWTIFKWSVLSRVYGVPFLFVSIGKSSLERPLSRFFARIALRLAEYRSYRDNDSKMAVQALIDAQNDPVYPDLAFSYPCPIVQASRRNGSRDNQLVVGVSPIAYCDPRAWPLKDQQRYAAYVSQLAEMVKWLIKERHRVLFFTTDSPDIRTVDDVQARISGIAIDADAIQILPDSTEQSPDSLLKGIADADLIIASRLHGVILSHLNNTPVLALSFDPKVDAHMNAAGQQDYCLNIDHLQVETLIERFSALKAARQQERAHIRSTALHYRHLLDLQYDHIFGALPSSYSTSDHHNQIDALRLSEIGGSRAR